MTKRIAFQHQISSKVVVQSFKRLAIPNGVVSGSVLVPDEFDHLKIGDLRRFLTGCLFSLIIAFTNGLLYNVIRRSTFETFDAPAFVIWFRCLFRAVVFPMYLLVRWLGRIILRKKAKPEDEVAVIFKEAGRIYGDKEVTLGRFLLDISCLTILSTASQWLNYWPLYAVSGAGDMAALATSSLSFIFIFCVIFLRIDLMSMKMFGAVINLSGVLVLALFEMVANYRWRQSLLILAGAFFTAAYQVTFKVRVGGTTNLARISYFVSMLAIFMAVFMWPLILTLKFSGVEKWDFKDLPWSYLLMTSSAVFGIVLITNAGISRINPFFTSLGFLLTCPVTFGVEMYLTQFRRVHFIEYTGAGIAMFGAILLVFADVSTWSTVKREWRKLLSNVKWMQSRTGKTLARSMQATVVEINQLPAGRHRVPRPELKSRSYSVDTTLAVPQWSQTGTFKAIGDAP